MKKKILVLLLSLPFALKAATITSTANGGSWGATTTWVGGHVPATTDDVVIATTSGHSVNTASGFDYCASVTINSNAILNINGGGVGVIGGLTTNNGTIEGSGNLGFTGLGTVLTGGGDWSSFSGKLFFYSVNGGQTIDASVDINSSMTHIYMEPDASTWTTAGPVRVTNNGIVKTSNGTLTSLNTAYSCNWINAAGATLKVTGASLTGSKDSLTASASGNMVIYGGSGNYNIKTPVGATYDGLTCAGTGTVSLAAALTTNNLTVSSGTLDSKTFQVTGNSSGTMTMSSGATLLLGTTASTTNVSFPTNFTSANISLDAASTVKYLAKTASQSVSVTPTYGNLMIDAGSAITKTPSGTPLAIGGNLTINTNATLSETTNTINLTGSATINGSLTYSSGSLNIGGDFTNNGTFTEGTGTVTFNGTGTQNINGTATTTFNNLTVAGSGSQDVKLNYALTVNGDVTLSSGDLDVTTSNYGITMYSNGNWTNNGGTFSYHSGTVTFYGSTIGGSNNSTFYNMEVIGSLSLNSSIRFW